MKNKHWRRETLKPIFIIFFALFVNGFGVFAKSTYAQTTRLSLELSRVTIKNVFETLEKNSEYVFFYPSTISATLDQIVDIHAKSETIDVILPKVLKNTGLSYVVNDRQIIINKSLTGEQEKGRLINGTVVDAANNPLPGVNITIKGTAQGASTDIDGNFYIEVSDNKAVLVFQYIGFKSQEITVGKSINLNVILKEDLTDLEEVVVIGYGTQKKGSVIGSLDQLDPGKLRMPTRTLSTSLAGRLAGIVAVQSSGEPGYDSADFWIRGVNTFTGSSNPLILVDGVERSLDDVDPEEIENFTILKDATATAVYGVRGANGVVLISTKRGIMGKPRINFRTEVGFSNPLQLPEFVDGANYMRLQNEALTNSGKSPLYNDSQIERTESGYDKYYYPDVNWMDELITHWNPTERVTLNVSGGSEKARYFVAGAFLNQDGMFKKFGGVSFNNNINVKRYNFRSNVDINMTRTTLLGINIAAILEDRNYPATSTGDIFNYIFRIPPVLFPMTYPDASKVPGYAFGKSTRNPYQLLARSGYSTENRTTMQSNLNISQDLSFITEGLRVRGVFSFDAYNQTNIKREMKPRPYLIKPWSFDENDEPVLLDEEGNYNYQDQEPNNSDYYDYLKRSIVDGYPYSDRTIYMEASLVYNRSFGKHNLGALLLYNQSDKQYPSKKGIYESVPNRHQGLTGRLTYDYDTKYFAETNFGYNGSENFRKGKRYGFFPSIALGWVPTKEKFMDFLKPAIDYMKIRVSHGIVGNDGLNYSDGSSMRFVYMTRVEETDSNVGFGTNNGYGYGYGKGINLTYYGNRDATWERAAKTDLGFEVDFLKNFKLQADLFYEKRKDIWVELSKTPGIFGYTSNPYGNVGEMENKGIDGFIEYMKAFNDDFSMNLKGTFTFARNKVLANGEETKKYEYQSIIGRPYGSILGYVAEGLFTDQSDIDSHPDQIAVGGTSKPGDIKYKDLNNDWVIDQFDRQYIGHPQIPELTYGFGGAFTYKNFDMSFLFQGAACVSFIANPKMFPEENMGNVYSFVKDSHWDPEVQNVDVDFPRLGVGAQDKNYVTSTWWLQDGHYLRLKQLEFGYSVPKMALAKFNMEGLRFYINGLNLFTLSSFKWWDVESRNSSGMYYPVQRVVNVGVQVNF
ncbi:MAG: TonB-dependent receptor [Massilibacteroides sp.]|nr:TonB-dependent receptor [Massilibacteroides sp.]MDD4659657.1 TonB-dependent receptor [Massilibacteroides sp.]